MADTALTQSDDAKAIAKAKQQFNQIVQAIPLERQVDLLRELLNQPPPTSPKSRP